MSETRPQTVIDESRPSWWTSDEWMTPPALFDSIAAIYGPFDLDAAARRENAKAPRFYTKADDGLRSPWFGRVWINPPYSDPKPWCQRAVEAAHGGEADLVVMLLPAAVDTIWFHDWVIPYAAWKPLRGRPRFLGWMGTPIGSPKAGNVLAVYPGQGLLP